MPSESSLITPVAVLIGAIASLAPLAKTIGDWHLKNKKLELSKPSEPNLVSNSELAAAIKKGDDMIRKREKLARFLKWFTVFTVFLNLGIGLVGASILVSLTAISAPLEIRHLAQLTSAIILIYLGWIRKQPWEEI